MRINSFVWSAFIKTVASVLNKISRKIWNTNAQYGIEIVLVLVCDDRLPNDPYPSTLYIRTG